MFANCPEFYSIPEFFADQEVDEVYIPDERQEPEQLARQQEICEVARQLRELGDRYTDKYGPNLNVSDVCSPKLRLLKIL